MPVTNNIAPGFKSGEHGVPRPLRLKQNVNSLCDQDFCSSVRSLAAPGGRPVTPPGVA